MNNDTTATATTLPIQQLARFLAGDGADYEALRLTWPDLPTDRRAALLWVQGRPDLASAILNADLDGSGSDGDGKPTTQDEYPALPDWAQPDCPARDAGAWLDGYIEQARAVSPMTPTEFHESAALWLGGVAIARRLVLPMAFGDIYPNLFVLWIAPTTLYRKSTALNFARDIARLAFPYLFAPQDTTPEALLSDLAGMQPVNLGNLTATLQAQWEQGRKFAAQKGLCIDELSGLLAGAGRDYNAGLIEAFLRLYDCEREFTRSTRATGWLTVRNGYLSLLGASTPAALGQHLQAERLWANGFWPRFAMLTPKNKPEWQEARAAADTDNLAAGLRRLATGLPEPTADNPPPAQPVTIDADAYQAWQCYNRALSYDLLTDSLDQRLYGTYGRLPTQALKIAIILVALDRLDRLQSLKIEKPYLTRAIEIAETWRSGAHRALLGAQQDESDRVRQRVLYQIERAEPRGATMRDLCKAIKDKNPLEIEAAIHELTTAGEVEAIRQGSSQQGGRPTDRYRLFRG